MDFLICGPTATGTVFPYGRCSSYLGQACGSVFILFKYYFRVPKSIWCFGMGTNHWYLVISLPSQDFGVFMAASTSQSSFSQVLKNFSLELWCNLARWWHRQWDWARGCWRWGPQSLSWWRMGCCSPGQGQFIERRQFWRVELPLQSF